MLRSNLLVVLLALALAAVWVGADPCTSKPDDPCSTTCNGTDYNIKQIWPDQPQNLSDSQSNKYTYQYDCAGLTCGTQTGVVLCQFDSGQKAYYALGTTESAKWNILNKTSFNVTYMSSDTKRTTVVLFKIDTTQGNTAVQEPKSNYYLITFSVTSFGGSDTIAGPVGIVLIFLTIGAVIVYFIVGGLIMYFAKGARGVEVIPNYTFWKGLPGLFKDAILFIVSPCRKSGKYESI